jgi:hypothetical protein
MNWFGAHYALHKGLWDVAWKMLRYVYIYMVSMRFKYILTLCLFYLCIDMRMHVCLLHRVLHMYVPLAATFPLSQEDVEYQVIITQWFVIFDWVSHAPSFTHPRSSSSAYFIASLGATRS